MSEDDTRCREMETRTCPPAYAGPCGDRPCARFESDDPTPWESDTTMSEGDTTGWTGANLRSPLRR